MKPCNSPFGTPIVIMARNNQIAIPRSFGRRQNRIQRRNCPPIRKEMTTLHMRSRICAIIILGLHVLDKRKVRVGALVRVDFFCLLAGPRRSRQVFGRGDNCLARCTVECGLSGAVSLESAEEFASFGSGFASPAKSFPDARSTSPVGDQVCVGSCVDVIIRKCASRVA
jgi:hypothetical protein